MPKLNLSPRATALQLSLLASLGLLPMACGGTTHNSPNNENGGTESGGSGSGGKATGGSPSSAGTSSSGGSGTTNVECTSPMFDAKTGLVTCAEGYVHRPMALTCAASAKIAPSMGGTNSGDPNTLPRASGAVPCEEDPTVCDAFQYGYCASSQGGQICASGCATDQDCGADAICLCGDALSPTGGVCTSSDCQTDADCGSGMGCASYTAACGGGYACQTAKDTCSSQQDCKVNESCQPNGEGHRACAISPVCGRPFLVAAAARVAPAVNNGDWRSPSSTTPQVEHLSAAQRAALAEHWTRMGQMEHASIAAFARFSLQLLSLGAPPELVEACTRALSDETAHTRLCFELASAYAGHAVGPGPLDVQGSLTSTSLDQIVDLVIAEGCFGETGAALEALEAAESAADPVIRAAYARIAEDEQRHAELAFRFVRWALQRDYAAVRPRVMAALTHRQHAIASLVAPCLEALLFANEAA